MSGLLSGIRFIPKAKRKHGEDKPLRHKPTINEEDKINSAPNASSDTAELEKLDPPHSAKTTTVEKETTKTSCDNYSAAELLRSRLQKSVNKSIPTAEKSEISNEPISSISADINYQKIVHLQKLSNAGKVDNLRLRENLEFDMDKSLAHDIIHRTDKRSFVGDRAGRDEDDLDEVTSRPSKASKKDTSDSTDSLIQKQARHQAEQHRKLLTRIDRCWRCRGLKSITEHSKSDSNHINDEHLICLGEYFALRLKEASQSIAEGHCELIPLSHVSSVLSLCDKEPEAWTEMKRFRSSLAALFFERGDAVIFMEANVRIQSLSHAVVDVVPARRDIAKLEVKAGFKQVRLPFGLFVVMFAFEIFNFLFRRRNFHLVENHFVRTFTRMF